MRAVAVAVGEAGLRALLTGLVALAVGVQAATVVERLPTEQTVLVAVVEPVALLLV